MQKVLHETCQQYVARRLSEGWSIVSQSGYHLILSSPDGNILRPVDLRNDVETLRPSGLGTYEDISNATSGDGNHHLDVDEEVPDDTTSTVYQTAGVTKTDTYALPAHSEGSGTINDVKVYVRLAILSDATGGWGKATIYTHDSLHYGDEIPYGDIALYSAFSNHSHTWTKNPNTTNDWTWDEVDALEAGITLARTDKNIWCTQVYVEVDYTPALAVGRSHGYIIG
ncbi:hypothetical protein ES708_14951 [subsurface metagenome]